MCLLLVSALVVSWAIEAHTSEDEQQGICLYHDFNPCLHVDT